MLGLRVCARYGQDPFGNWWEGLGPGRQALLIAAERVLGRLGT